MPTSYTLTAIDDPAAGVGPGAGTTPVSINAQGQVAGYYFDSSGQKYGFLDTNRTFTDAAVPSETLPSVSVPGADTTDVTGVNDLGRVVGYYYESGSYTAHGFVDTNGTFTTIDFPGNVGGTFLYGINDAGQVVGSYFDSLAFRHGFVDTNGAFAIVDAPGAGSPGVPGVVGTELIGINAAGEVIGYYVDSGETVRGFSATPPAGAQPSTILGSPGRQVTSDAAEVTPFAGVPGLGLFNGVFTEVSVIDPNPGATDALTIDLVDSQGQISDADGKLFGNGLVESSTQPGTYTLSAATPATLSTELDALTFAPTPHQVAPGDIVTTTFYIRDTNSTDLNQTAVDSSTSVTVVARDDAPFIEFAKAGQAVSNNASIQPFSTIDVVDVDRGVQDSATITLSGAGGTLSGKGLSATGAAGTYSLAAASSATLTTELEALTFTPANGTPGTSSTTTFSLTVSQTGAGNLSTTDNTTTVINTVQARTSTISGTQAKQPTSDEATIRPFANATITDPNAAGTIDTAEVTFGNTANGSLSDPNQATDGGVFDNGTYIIQGSASAVTAGLRGLVFTPTPHQVTPGQTVTTTFTLSDQNSATFNFATFSAPTVTDSTTSVVATAVNDAPAISGAKANQATNNYASVKPFSGVSISDPDVGARVSLTIGVAGSVTFGGGGTLAGAGLSQTGTAGVYSLAAASPAALTAELGALTFTPAAATPSTFQVTTFALSAAQAAGGSTSTATDSTTTVFNNVSPPLPSFFSGTQAGQRVTDASTIKPFSAAVLTDPNGPYATDGVVIVLPGAGGTATDANGTLSGAGLTKIGTGAYKLVAGNAGAVTAELDSLVFTPSKVTQGSLVVTTFVLYDFNSLNVNQVDSATSVVATPAGPPIVGRGAPPPPVTSAASTITVPAADQAQMSTGLATVTPFAGVTIADANAGSPAETVTVTPSTTTVGTLADPNHATDGSSTNSSTGAITLTGSATAVTADLDALTFTPGYGQSGQTSFSIADQNSAGQTTTPPGTAAVTIDLPTITMAQLQGVGTDLLQFYRDDLTGKSTTAIASKLAGDFTSLDISKAELGQLLGQALTSATLASSAATTLGIDIASLYYPKLAIDLTGSNNAGLVTDLTKMVVTTVGAGTDDLLRRFSGQSTSQALAGTVSDFSKLV